MKIFLIGFMGCGKSTLGRKLAVKMAYDLIDLDHKVEEKTGSTIASYFAEHGEETFRKLERDTLQSFPYPKNSVIATGGGTPCFFDNMDWMNANGLTVYIDMPAQALAKRLEKGAAKRPLLQGLNEEALVNFIEEKLAERRKYYENARLKISGINLTPDVLRAAILALH
ncbi:shikimate kinase [Pedobacter sp. AW31-3R]|uniref:shikimate kinase n=1 Tax=Pedobacter sp. AW31-3R TaxID=3445781 RepID=UPI003F9F1DCF